MDITGLIDHRESVPGDTTVEAVSAHFHHHSREFMAVCEGRRVIGLCSRAQVAALLSGRYGFALHSRMPIARRRLEGTLLFPADGSLHDLLAAALSREGDAFLHDVAIVDDEGALVGLVSTRRLVAAQSALVKSQVARIASQEKAALVQTLVAGIAHELNNKLMPVLGYAELLIAELSAGDTSRAIDYSCTLRDAAVEGARIVRQILQLSRPVAAERQPLDLREVVEQSLTLTGLRIRETGTVVDLHLPARPIVVDGDAGQLKQLTVNLVLNALDAMESSEVRKLAITVGEVQGIATLAVQDNGAGIPEEHLNRIFDPFFTTKGPSRGTGLGLGVSASIARQHRGAITVDSIVGRGSTFVLSLPLARPDEHAAVPVEAETLPTPQVAARTVLVIDDDDLVAKVVGDTVRRRLGVHVERVSDGLAAQQAIQARMYDLVVCDVRMPVLSGLDLVRWMREHAPGQLARTVLMTGEMGVTSLDDEIVVAGVPVLRKPFTSDALFAELSALLDDRAA